MGRWLSLLAIALLAALAAAPASANIVTSTSLSRAQPEGASASAAITVFTIDGTPFPTRIDAFIGDSGRLTLVSPEGITAPSSPSGICTQDSTTQVSCNPGAIGAIAGDLEGGSDTFTADPALTVAVGMEAAGVDNPLIGGGGRDRIIGGAASDLIHGGPNADSIEGNGATDVLRGEAGRDDLSGGASPDALFGGAGPDKLNGGGGRDLCSGGGGVDAGKSCNVRKGIP
jgi:Ca2+-binding RTX toxin-like protein